MRIIRVDALSFGPFRDANLEPAEGMTIVAGPNESGKSSWHAAIYAALCGMRRGPGARARDKEFAERYKPWNEERWQVSCIVELGDGRRIELCRDLAGRSGTAVDLAIGRDVSPDIMQDGAPDGSRWLGLDRRAFFALACVQQAEILAITEQVDALQEHLQRAAATAGTDETAAAALRAIDEYRRERIGTDRAPTKPLARTRQRLEDAKLAVAQAETAHKGWLEEAERVHQHEIRVERASRSLRVAEAAHTRAESEWLGARVSKARPLTERHPGEPAFLVDDQPLMNRVFAAIQGWRNRPVPVALEGTSSAEIEVRLLELPDAPADGDREPAPVVTAATRGLEEARARLLLHREQQPHNPGLPETGGLTERQLDDLARELEVPVPPVSPDLRADVQRLRSADGPSRGGWRQGVLIAGVIAVVVGAATGIGGLVASYPAVSATGLALALIGAALVVVPLFRGLTEGDPATALRDAEGRLRLAEELAFAASRRVSAAVEQARAHGLAPDPSALRRLGDVARSADQAATAARLWEQRFRQLEVAVSASRAQVARALSERRVMISADASDVEIGGALASYQKECSQRAELASRVRERAALTQALTERRQREDAAAEASRRTRQAAAELQEAAAAAGLREEVGVVRDSEDDIAAKLAAWHAQRAEQARLIAEARREWDELQQLLDGQTLDELSARAEAASIHAAELATDLEAAEIAAAELGPNPQGTIRQLRQAAQQLETSAVRARTTHESEGKRLPRVAEAIEELTAAATEEKRIQSVVLVLDTTESHLRGAQERVHRSIAPVLGRKVQDRLARVTGGRYQEVVVDPETLEVRVRDNHGTLRNAGLLSHGTAEQVYLLLRVAMAEILARDLACPLLLDDVTVQSDHVRTCAILDVLHDVSQTHQVILFSQADGVAAWADSNLGPRDRLTRLGGL